MPRKSVVDTNVAIAANGRETHASLKCQLACVQELEKCRKIHLALDDLGLVMEEYRKHLNFRGQPGVGDMFFKYLHDNQYNSKKIQRVKITPSGNPSDDQARGFAELPENRLDRADRKFLAVAVVAQATVVNATDSDWAEQQELLDRLGVPVKQLCDKS